MPVEYEISYEKGATSSSFVIYFFIIIFLITIVLCLSTLIILFATGYMTKNGCSLFGYSSRWCSPSDFYTTCRYSRGTEREGDCQAACVNFMRKVNKPGDYNCTYAITCKEIDAIATDGGETSFAKCNKA
ncbi:unnamed protein product, partial [marine sediment metagenome]